VSLGRARRLAPAALALALLTLGCGGDDDTGASGVETSAPPSQFEPEAPAPELADEVAVVDLAGIPAAEPERLQFAADASVERIRWRGWGAPRTVGTGRARVLVCEPNCAEGDLRFRDARVVLSRPVTCSGQRYYDRARIAIPGPPGQPPQAFIEAPC
jgi:hypothetical protein